MEAGTANKTERVTPTMALMQAREKLLAHGEDVSKIDQVLRSGINGTNPKCPHPVFDHLLSALSLRNDAALSRALNVDPPVVSKIRHGVNNFSASMAIMAHELTGISFADMRKMLGMAEGEKF